MPEDNTEVVQTERTSTEESTQETSTEESQDNVLAPEAEERVQKMIAEATAKAVAEAKEVGRRELQAQQDRNREEMRKAERRAQVAESRAKGARTSLVDLDPELSEKLELAELKAERDALTKASQEEEVIRQQAAFHTAFIEQQSKFIEDLGLDPKDSRIDWADDAPNYIEAMGRIQTSLAKIQKENIGTMTSGFEERLKSLESKLNEGDTEANSVDTSTSAGVVSASDAEFMKKFGGGELPVNKENIDRYEKLRESYQ